MFDLRIIYIMGNDAKIEHQIGELQRRSNISASLPRPMVVSDICTEPILTVPGNVHEPSAFLRTYLQGISLARSAEFVAVEL